MRFTVRSLVVGTVAAVTAAIGAAQVQISRPPAAPWWGATSRSATVPMPDLAGYRTLKADFHLHTVFSDGEVWPTTHVFEAWRDGLDVIALTDHADYHPHKDYVKVEGMRSYEIARPLAEQLGLILIPGAEISHHLDREDPTLGPAHFNALFVTDPDALNVPDLLEALRRARAQNAFVFWNHPGRARNVRWFPIIATAHDAGLFAGMELVNGDTFFPEVFPWIEEKKLTILCNSDIHEPTPPRSLSGTRPMTLLFVRSADAKGVREALVARRTAAWMGDELWGAEEYLRGLWKGAVEIETPEVQAGPYSLLRVRNRSAIPFEFRVLQAPEWFGLESARIHPEASSLLRFEARNAPAGVTAIDLELELTNLHVVPGHQVRVRMPLRVRR